MITYKAFTKSVELLGITIWQFSAKGRRWTATDLADHIEITWELGSYETSEITLPESACGFTDTETIYRPKAGDIEKDFLDLHTILEKYVPDITFLQYKRLWSSIVENEVFEQDNVFYACKSITIRKLYNYFISQKWIKGRKVKE